MLVKERTQTNVCKAQRSPTVESVRLTMSGGKERKGTEAGISGKSHHLIDSA